MSENEIQVVVVEDNLLNLELVTDLLTAHRFIVHAARTAEEGIRLAGSVMPDLVLMDISLPGMDGLSAVKSLRDHPATEHLLIVALTAHAMKGDEATALNGGCDGYLTKPINTRSFINEITRFLSSANLHPAR